MKRKTLVGVALFLLIALAIWASDRITLQGERTIFAVNCDGGEWQASRCTGKLAAADQYAFRASKSRHEVLYWIRFSDTPSGKFTDCMVKDRDNWSCNVRSDARPALTFEMKKGTPTRAGIGLTMPFHSVPKWKWWAIRLGLSTFTNADD